MKFINKTFSTPGQNLAFDELLLQYAENGELGPMLRTWEAPSYFVVLGHTNKISREVNTDECRKNNVPILRRASGGGTVLQGPGSLSYALILPISSSLGTATIDETTNLILNKHKNILSVLTGKNVKKEGSSDLTIDGLKFSGNAQRRRRKFLLFHGTFLLQFDLDKISQFLPYPSKAPDYRKNRSHGDFLCNLQAVAPKKLHNGLCEVWDALEPLSLPRFALEELEALALEKYDSSIWTFKF